MGDQKNDPGEEEQKQAMRVSINEISLKLMQSLQKTIQDKEHLTPEELSDAVEALLHCKAIYDDLQKKASGITAEDLYQERMRRKYEKLFELMPRTIRLLETLASMDSSLIQEQAVSLLQGYKEARKFDQTGIHLVKDEE